MKGGWSLMVVAAVNARVERSTGRLYTTVTTTVTTTIATDWAFFYRRLLCGCTCSNFDTALNDPQKRVQQSPRGLSQHSVAAVPNSVNFSQDVFPVQ